MEPDWIKVKTDYITGTVGCRVVAEKYGIPYTTLRSRATNENWYKEQKKYREKLVAKAADKIARKQSGKLAALATSADTLADQIMRALADDKQLYRYQVQRREKYPRDVAEKTGIEEKQWVEDYVSTKMDTKAAKDLTAALCDLTRTIRDLYSLPNAAEQEAMAVARERLKLEQEKAGANGDRELHVIIDQPEGEPLDE